MAGFRKLHSPCSRAAIMYRSVMQLRQLCVITLNPALVVTQPAVLNATVAATNVYMFRRRMTEQ